MQSSPRLAYLVGLALVGLAVPSCSCSEPIRPPADAAPDGPRLDAVAFDAPQALDAPTQTDADAPAPDASALDAPSDEAGPDAGDPPDAGDLFDGGAGGDASAADAAGGPDAPVVAVLTCADVCHGDAESAAPPLSVDGLLDTASRGVGAHRSHLGASLWHREIVCEDCHVVPATVRAPGHFDTPTPAELRWSALATADGATPTFDGVTCSGAYCHGATLLPGGIQTAPTWTTVDGTEAACGTCHGLPPGGSHPTSMECSTCHETVDAALNIVDPARHIDGVVDVTALSCTSCHGDAATGPAPPADTRGGTATTSRGVGAHASHLRPSAWHRDVACTDCHIVPVTPGDAGHLDGALPAELTFGPIATTDGATPAFDGTRCAGAYCHGATLLPGGTNTTPTWTTVDGTEAACGSCHGLPPGGSHPPSGACSTCHPTMDASGAIVDGARHIDGVLDVTGTSCTSCHGDLARGPAPPLDTTGGSATTRRGVGAHASHLRTADWHRDIACTECHVLPSAVTDAGHLDTALPAELTFGALATTDGAAPAFDGSTCSGAYCHGATLLPGGTNTTPRWTTVDGSQAACGTCHGLPPGGSHPAATDCSTCHPTVDAARNVVDRTRHIDGTVDVVALTCTSCHGDVLTGPAPPFDTTGGSSTSRRGVGAHASHLRTSSWRRLITCTECHVVPVDATDAGHIDGALPADLTFGPLARADAASPVFDGTSCSGAYCHGATLRPGGSDTTPTWTTVDGTQAACGTCHGLPPGGSHPPERDCSMCHGAVVDALGTITSPSLHINGVVDRSTYHPAGWAAPTSHGRELNARGPGACTDCHGPTLTGGGVGVSCETCHADWQPDCTFCHGDGSIPEASPPEGVDGETLRTVLSVGAHREHVRTTSTHVAWDCTMCHGPTTPTSALSPGHIDGDGRAEEVFGPIRGAGTTYALATGVCSSTYCHGNGYRRAPAPPWSSDPTLGCGSCHAPFSGWTETQLRAMSGRHDLHVRGERIACSECHGAVVGAGGALLRVDLHVDGIVQTSVPTFDPTACGGRGGCTPTCHGLECWR